MTGWARDRRGWFERRDGAVYGLARRLPARWDLRAETGLPDMGRRRLAHAVRQDMWRALRAVPGFAPVVEVERVSGGVVLRAGGAVRGPVPDGLRDRLTGLLADPLHRAAWARCARHRA